MNRRNGRNEKGEETRIVKQINKIEKEDYTSNCKVKKNK